MPVVTRCALGVQGGMQRIEMSWASCLQLDWVWVLLVGGRNWKLEDDVGVAGVVVGLVLLHLFGLLMSF
jgi:hypothetical protein